MTEYAFCNAPGAPNFSFEDLRESPDTKLLIRTFGLGKEQVAGVGNGGLLFWLKGEEITKAMAAFPDPTKTPASTGPAEVDVVMNPPGARGFSFEVLRDAPSRKQWLICEDTHGRDLVGAVNEQDTIIWLEGKEVAKAIAFFQANTIRRSGFTTSFRNDPSLPIRTFDDLSADPLVMNWAIVQNGHGKEHVGAIDRLNRVYWLDDAEAEKALDALPLRSR